MLLGYYAVPGLYVKFSVQPRYFLFKQEPQSWANDNLLHNYMVNEHVFCR